MVRVKDASKFCTYYMLFPGGRQIDGAIASLDALDEICTSEKIKDGQQSGKFAVLFDSGIRTGSDMIKALALGAQAVLRTSALYPRSQFYSGVF